MSFAGPVHRLVAALFAVTFTALIMAAINPPAKVVTTGFAAAFESAIRKIA